MYTNLEELMNSYIMKKNNLSIGVLGLWHLGLVYSVCFAKSGYKVFGFDLDKDTVNDLNNGNVSIYEPQLTDLFIENLNKNLFISANAKGVIQNKDYIFITLDIPVNDRDEINLNLLDKLFDLALKYVSKKTTLVISSQIPIGTTRNFLKRLGSDFNVIYFPENLRLGSAINDFLNPARIILGANNDTVVNKFLKDFPIFKCNILKMSLESAEMLKHALNCYIALNISFSSELSDLCEALGADARDVVLGLKSDPRVSPKAPINPGLGFAGGTLGRDVKTLLKLSKKIKYPAYLLKASYRVNQNRMSNLIKKIKKIYPKIKGKKIGLLGLTYKPNTNTLRRSQSLDLAKHLAKEKVELRAFDPVIKNDNFKNIKLFTSLKVFLKNLDLLILMTEWPEFRDINPKLISGFVNQKIIIDTKNYLDQEEYLKHGFKFIGIGQGQ